MYEIKNVSLKERFCGSKLLKPMESIETNEELFVSSARLSPQIFEVKEIKTKKTKKEAEE